MQLSTSDFYMHCTVMHTTYTKEKENLANIINCLLSSICMLLIPIAIDSYYNSQTSWRYINSQFSPFSLLINLSLQPSFYKSKQESTPEYSAAFSPSLTLDVSGSCSPGSGKLLTSFSLQLSKARHSPRGSGCSVLLVYCKYEGLCLFHSKATLHSSYSWFVMVYCSRFWPCDSEFTPASGYCSNSHPQPEAYPRQGMQTLSGDRLNCYNKVGSCGSIRVSSEEKTLLNTPQ